MQGNCHKLVDPRVIPGELREIPPSGKVDGI